MDPADLLWTQLGFVSRLQFTSESRTGIGWAGAGGGVVAVTESKGTIIYSETGTWNQSGGNEIRFQNTYRWTRQGFLIRLEHLRFGTENPVFLFDLSAGADGVWRELEPHACRLDHYAATLLLVEGGFDLNWRVTGVNRDEIMNYEYR